MAQDCGCGGGSRCVTKTAAFTFFPFALSLGAMAVGYWGQRNADNNNILKFGISSALGAATVYFFQKPIKIMLTHFIPNYYEPLSKEDILQKKFQDLGDHAELKLHGEGNYVVTAKDQGSKIWVKNGPHYIKAGKGSDNFYFSLCSTKIVNKKVTTIENFDSMSDKINFFCSKKNLSPSDFKIAHYNDSTCIEVKGESHLGVVCLTGYVDIIKEDINITSLGLVEQEFEGV
jgi:hypothetical protein